MTTSEVVEAIDAIRAAGKTNVLRTDEEHAAVDAAGREAARKLGYSSPCDAYDDCRWTIKPGSKIAFALASATAY